MSNLQEQLDELQREWKIINTLPGYFIEEGFTNEELWNSSSLKIMVLLKEPNANEEFKYYEFIRNQVYLNHKCHTRLWEDLMLWIYGIFNNFMPYTELFTKDYREASKTFMNSVFISNIKKTTGGSHADEHLLVRAAMEGSDLLLRQFAITEPNIILCGGKIVFALILQILLEKGEIIETKITDGGLIYIWWQRLSIKIIRYYHPGAHLPRDLSYTYLMSELKKIM